MNMVTNVQGVQETRSPSPCLRLACAVVVTCLAAATAFASSVYAQAASNAETEAEARVLELVNQARAAAGAAPLVVHAGLTSLARGWAQGMATSGSLNHNSDLLIDVESSVSEVVRTVAENIGHGEDIEALHDAFLKSSGHRTIMLTDFDLVGVGVALVESRWWVTLDFAEIVGDPSPSEPEDGEQAEPPSDVPPENPPPPPPPPQDGTAPPDGTPPQEPSTPPPPPAEEDGAPPDPEPTPEPAPEAPSDPETTPRDSPDAEPASEPEPAPAPPPASVDDPVISRAPVVLPAPSQPRPAPQRPATPRSAAPAPTPSSSNPLATPTLEDLLALSPEQLGALMAGEAGANDLLDDIMTTTTAPLSFGSGGFAAPDRAAGDPALQSAPGPDDDTGGFSVLGGLLLVALGIAASLATSFRLRARRSAVRTGEVVDSEASDSPATLGAGRPAPEPSLVTSAFATPATTRAGPSLRQSLALSLEADAPSATDAVPGHSPRRVPEPVASSSLLGSTLHVPAPGSTRAADSSTPVTPPSIADELRRHVPQPPPAPPQGAPSPEPESASVAGSLDPPPSITHQDRHERAEDVSKADSLSVVLLPGRPVKDVAEELGITDTTLAEWVQAENRKAGLTEVASRDHDAQTQEENERLKRQVAELEEERELLKRTTAFWVKESGA